MADRTFASLEPQMAPHVPGCPRPTIVEAVRVAAIEVCENTLVWRYEQPLLTLSTGIYEYEYDTPSSSEVCGVIHVALNGVKVDVLTEEQVHALYPAWPDTANTAGPRYITQLDPDHFLVAPVPDDVETYNVKMFLALRPTTTATAMAATPFDEAEQVIMAAALHRLLSIPDRSWTNKDLANYYLKQVPFRSASRRAKANLGTGRASLSVRMVPFG